MFVVFIIVFFLFFFCFFFFFSSRRRHTRWTGDWSSDVCSSISAADRGAMGDERVEQRGGQARAGGPRSEERRVGKSVDLGGRRIIKKKKEREEEGGGGSSEKMRE